MTAKNASSLANTGTKMSDPRFEFVFYINDHIICQRFFDIYGFNEKSTNSYELKEVMDNITGINTDSFGSMGIIPRYLKKKTQEYLWDNYNPYDPKIEIRPIDGTFKIDNFQFEIKVDRQTVAKSYFSGMYFPPRVRYAIDIRDIIPDIMREIRNGLSHDSYTMSPLKKNQAFLKEEYWLK